MKEAREGNAWPERRWLQAIQGGALVIALLGCAPGPPEVTGAATLAALFEPIRSIDPDDTDFSDLEGLGQALAGAEVVLLGEPVHGSNSGVAARARLVKFLHSRMGFSILAYEASFYGAAQAWEEARTAEDPQTILANGVHGGWSKRHGAPLFRYLAAEMKGATPLRLAGVDPDFINGGSPEKTLRFESEAMAYLSAWGCASSWTSKIRTSLVELAGLREEATPEQRIPLYALLGALKSSMACLTGAPGWPGSPEDEFWRQVFFNVDALARQKWSDPADPGLPLIRDRTMADNVAWLRARHPGEKIIVWAANVHIARTLADVRDGTDLANPGERPMGQYLSELLGSGLFALMTTSDEVIARDGERMSRLPVDRRDVLEAELENRGSHAGWVNLRTWKATAGNQTVFTTLAFGLVPRSAPWGEVADGLLYLPVLDATNPGP